MGRFGTESSRRCCIPYPLAATSGAPLSPRSILPGCTTAAAEPRRRSLMTDHDRSPRNGFSGLKMSAPRLSGANCLPRSTQQGRYFQRAPHCARDPELVRSQAGSVSYWLLHLQTAPLIGPILSVTGNSGFWSAYTCDTMAEKYGDNENYRERNT